MGLHPAIIVRTLKEKHMYFVVPLTTYTSDKWDKCKRHGFGSRIISTNSIARIDKINVITRKQIQSRYYNNGKMVIPNKDEIQKVMNRVEEYMVLSDRKSIKEYEKYFIQRTEFVGNINDLFNEGKIDDSIFSVQVKEKSILLSYKKSNLTFLTNLDIKDTISEYIKNLEFKITKDAVNIIIEIEVKEEDLLTYKDNYDKFKVQKGRSNT